MAKKKLKKETLRGATELAEKVIELENEVFFLLTGNPDTDPNLQSALDRIDEITGEEGELDKLRERLEVTMECEKAGIQEGIKGLEKELADKEEYVKLAIAEAICKIEAPKGGLLDKLKELQVYVGRLFHED